MTFCLNKHNASFLCISNRTYINFQSAKSTEKAFSYGLVIFCSPKIECMYRIIFHLFGNSIVSRDVRNYQYQQAESVTQKNRFVMVAARNKNNNRARYTNRNYMQPEQQLKCFGLFCRAGTGNPIFQGKHSLSLLLSDGIGSVG